MCLSSGETNNDDDNNNDDIDMPIYSLTSCIYAPKQYREVSSRE